MAAHKNIMMTTDERWKVNLFIAHPVNLFTVWFHPPDRVAKICDKLESSALHEPYISKLCNLELTQQIYYQYYSVDHIFVIVLSSMEPVWFVDTVYCQSQLHQKYHKHTCTYIGRFFLKISQVSTVSLLKLI